jgi:hypothetical protein
LARRVPVRALIVLVRSGVCRPGRLVAVLLLSAVAAGLICAATAKAETRLVRVTVPRDGPSERVYFYSRSQNESKLLALQKALIERGARSVNCFLPRVVVCELPVGLRVDEIANDPDIKTVLESQVDLERADKRLFEPGWIKRCYAQAEAPEIGGSLQSVSPGGESTISWGESEFTVPQETVRRTCKASTADYPEPRNIQQNSELMVGTILANLIFPESLPYAANHEDWTDEAIADATSQVMYGMLYYQNNNDYWKAGIHFVTRSTVGVATSQEPIDQRWGEASWITEVMDRLGYKDDGTTDRHLTAVHEFNNDKRNEFSTQWVFTAFIVNAKRDADHLFDMPKSVGWGYLGGPYFVVPHPAGSSTTAQAVRHYLGTVFWATEEGPGMVDNCSTFSGYLNVQNRNKVTYIHPIAGEVGCPGMKPPTLCIMNHIHAFVYGYTGEPCFYTSAMLGLSDGNYNSVPDCFDAPPVLYFEHAAVETIFAGDFSLRFRAVSEGVPNQNPWQDPDLRVNYATPVGLVGTSEKGVITRQILPLDGAFDELEEDFVIKFDILPGGPSTVSFITRNSVGATSKDQTKDIFFMGLSYTHFGYQNFNKGNLISFDLYGETFGASFDVHRTDLDGDQVDKVIATGKGVGAKTGQFTKFEYFDSTTDRSTIIPGHRYRYHLCGIFTATYRDRDTTITADTGEIETRAMIPVPAGRILSNATPNPFRESTLMSVVVPTIYEDPRLPVAMDMAVDVSVFDVLGRRVKRLLADHMVGQVVTLTWDGTNDRQEKVPTGVYFVKAVAGNAEGSTKVVIVR